MSSRKKLVSWLAGLVASLSLLLFYFLVTTRVTNDWRFPFRQFWELKLLMGPLVAGFGVQVGLFFYLRLSKRDDLRVKIGTGTSGGISGISMIACCAHHLTEILPIMGLSGAGLFLVSYQKELLFLGVISNLLGIWLMVKKIKENPK